jgi:hypothetical protein
MEEEHDQNEQRRPGDVAERRRHGAPDEAADPIEVGQRLAYQSFARPQCGEKGGFDHPLIQVAL